MTEITYFSLSSYEDNVPKPAMGQFIIEYINVLGGKITLWKLYFMLMESKCLYFFKH